MIPFLFCRPRTRAAGKTYHRHQLYSRHRSWLTDAFLALACFLMALLIGMSHTRQNGEALASRLAPSILRFHILANSDSAGDQQVKLEVRSLILDYLAGQLDRDGGQDTLANGSGSGIRGTLAAGDSSGSQTTLAAETGASVGGSKWETLRYLSDHRETVEALANDHLASRGFDYTASLELTNCYFPTRVYDRLVFPCGYYDAARIVLGNGDGHNWWCVLYPRFCFVDETCQEVPAESLDILRRELKQDDYLALKNRRPELQIRFKWLSFLNP